MFDIKKFSTILQKISDSYSSITEFAKKSEVNRTYLSKYINMKLDSPPTPKILEKIANSSNGMTTYEELMKICGYINENTVKHLYVDSYNILPSTYDDAMGSNLFNNLNDKEKKILSDMLLEISKTSSRFRINGKFDINKYLSDVDSTSREKIINNHSKMRNAQNVMFNTVLKTEEALDELNHNIGNSSKQAKILNNYQINKYYMCPVYGQISAGEPNWAEENIESRLPIDPNLMGLVNPEEHFFLRVNGESMNNIVKNGAFALIHKQDIVDDGEIAVVLVNGYDATLKRFTKKGDVVVLEPDSSDPSFKTQIYDKTTPIKILGKYVGKMEINN